MAEPVSLYERINRVKKGIKRVPKTGQNAHFNYKYATESDLSDMLRPLMAEHGVCLLYLGPDIDSVSVTDGETKTGGYQAHYRIWVKYQVVNVDKPEERETIMCPGEALDSQDKGMTKALTAAAKYCWLKLFDISTGDPTDEPDHGGGEEPKRVTAKPSMARPAPPPRAQPSPQAPTVPASVVVIGKVNSIRLLNRLKQNNQTLSDLRNHLYKRGYRAAVGDNKERPELWPEALTDEIIEFLGTVKEISATDPLLAGVRKIWEVWYPNGAKPQTGDPQTPEEVIVVMRGGGDWKEFPEKDRDAQMVEDLEKGCVLADGSKIPF